MLKNFIKEKLFDSKGRINSSRIKNNGEWIKKSFSIEYNKILETTKNIEDINFGQRLYHIINNIIEKPKCQQCKINETSFINVKVGYNKFCSVICSNNNLIVKEKIKKTNLEKYGYEYAILDKEKIEKALLEKYGINNISKTQHVKNILSNIQQNRDKIKKKVIVEKHKQTCVEKYGVDSYSKTDEFKDKIKNACLEKYGVDSYSKTDEFKDKIKETTSNKIKLEVFDDIVNEFKTEGYLLNQEEIPQNVKDTIKLICSNNHEWSTNINRWKNGHRCLQCSYSNISKTEKEIAEFIKQYFPNIIENSKSIIPPLEIDIFIPEKNIAIEFNGLYWHSDLTLKDKNYHLNKTNLCKERGIQLLHVFEDEWLYKKDIVKSILLSKLGIFENRVYARQCTVIEIDPKEKNRFLEENHIQGLDTSTYKLGLYKNGILLSVMTFGKRKITGSSNPDMEMFRFATKTGYQVIGGASKMFTYFVRKYKPNKVISYADVRYSNGLFYEKLGFTLKHISNPNYWYITEDRRREHRVKYQKHKLQSKLEFFDSSLTEWENMIKNGRDRIYDCGNYVYEWEEK